MDKQLDTTQIKDTFDELEQSIATMNALPFVIVKELIDSNIKSKNEALAVLEEKGMSDKLYARTSEMFDDVIRMDLAKMIVAKFKAEEMTIDKFMDNNSARAYAYMTDRINKAFTVVVADNQLLIDPSVFIASFAEAICTKDESIRTSGATAVLRLFITYITYKALTMKGVSKVDASMAMFTIYFTDLKDEIINEILRILN